MRSWHFKICVQGGKFDVLVTEIFDSGLIGEGLLNTLCHAVQHLAKENFVVIPARARVYVQLVQSSIMQQWKVAGSVVYSEN